MKFPVFWKAGSVRVLIWWLLPEATVLLPSPALGWLLGVKSPDLKIQYCLLSIFYCCLWSLINISFDVNSFICLCLSIGVWSKIFMQAYTGLMLYLSVHKYFQQMKQYRYHLCTAGYYCMVCIKNTFISPANFITWLFFFAFAPSVMKVRNMFSCEHISRKPLRHFL